MSAGKKILAGLPAMAVPVVVYGFLAFVWMWPTSLSPHDTISDVGDPLHLGYIMAWNAHQILRDPLRLFDSNSFHPWPQSLAFADHLVPESILVAPVQWLTGNAVLALNVAVFAGLFLSALFMRWLILEVTGHPSAALIAGVVYAFNGFTLVEANRVHVIQLQCWPLALLFLGRFVAEPTFKSAFGVAVALAVQGLSGSYYLVYTAMIAPLWLGLAYLGAARRPSPDAARRLTFAACVTALPVVAIMLPYLKRGLPQGRVSDGVDLMAYLSPDPRSSLWSLLLPTSPLGREFKGVIGLALMIVGVVVLLRSRPGRLRALGMIAVITAFIGVVFSMGETLSIGRTNYGSGPLHYLLEWLPLHGLRHTPRFNALAVLGGAVLAGLGLAAWLGKSRLATAIILVLVTVLPLEHWRDTRYGMKLPPPDSLRAIYADLPPAPLVDLPLYPMPRRRFWAAYLYLSTYHWNPIPIGRTSFYPPGHEFLAWMLDRFPDEASVSLLSQLGVRTVVVHPLVWPSPERTGKLEALTTLKALVPMNRPSPPMPPNVLELGDERYFDIKALPEAAPLCAPRAEIPASLLSVYPMGTTPHEGLAFMTDRDVLTRWSSGPDQAGWYGLQTVLASPQPLSAISLEFPGNRFPRAWPSLQLRRPGERWETTASPLSPEVAWEALSGELRGSRALRWVLRFDTRQVEAFRLVFATGAALPTPPLEIEELRAFAECRAS